MIKKNIELEALNSKHGNLYYLPKLTPASRENRRQATEAETLIWEKILRRKQTSYKFTRQKPVNRFILDFYCAELNLAIEIDGEYHKRKQNYDRERDSFLKQIGIKTIRFTNNEVLKDIEGVKIKISSQLKPALSREGGTTK